MKSFSLAIVLFYCNFFVFAFDVRDLLKPLGPSEASWSRQTCGPNDMITENGKKVSPSSVIQESNFHHPRPQMERSKSSWMSLNGMWNFEYATSFADLALPPFGHTLDGSILVPFPVESCLSGVPSQYEKVSPGYFWYQLPFALKTPEGLLRDNRLLLHFDAIDWQSFIYVDGKLAFEHEGGYDDFKVDITEYLTQGKMEHEILLFVYDPSDLGPQPHGKQVLLACTEQSGNSYCSTSGIWQNVWIELVPKVYIDEVNILKTSMDYASIEVKLQNPSSKEYLVQLSVYENFPEVSLDAVCTYNASISAEHVFNLKIQNPLLWSVDDPHLYKLKIELVQYSDTIFSYFGLRELNMIKDGLNSLVPTINGKKVFLHGWLDQSFFPDGLYTPPNENAIKSEIQNAKRFGYNTIRLHEKVNPDRWYYYADTLGVYILQDIPQKMEKRNDKTPDADATDVIFRHEAFVHLTGRISNHPSVIEWIIFNENDCWQYIKDMNTFYEDLRKLDRSGRWINMDSGGLATPYMIGDVNDNHHYPDPIPPPENAYQFNFIGEYGGFGLSSVNEHSYIPGNCHSYKAMNSTLLLVLAYEDMINSVDLSNTTGLIYTQATDVETECNGMIYYDRTDKFPPRYIQQIRKVNHNIIRRATN